MGYDAWKTTPPREDWAPGPNDCECGRELEREEGGREFCPECEPRNYRRSVARKCGCREVHELDSTAQSYRHLNVLRATACEAHVVHEPSWCDDEPASTPAAA